MIAVRAELQRLRGCFELGVSTRHSVYYYARFTSLVMLILLAIALAIDLTQSISKISSKAQETGAPAFVIAAPYLTYRIADIVTRLFPQACFLGVFIAEIIRAHRLEPRILALAGISPLQLVTPFLVFGLVAGILQTSLEGWLRPAAISAQVKLDVGVYADRYRPRARTNASWFVAGRNALRAFVTTGDSPELHWVELYRGYDSLRLTSVIFAAKAEPADVSGIWKFHDVVVWTDRNGTGIYGSETFPVLKVDFDLQPEQLRYMGIPAYFLKWPALKKVASIRNARGAAQADVAILRRWTAFLLPGVFVLLAGTLAQFGSGGVRLHAPALIAFALFGYFSIVSIKVFWALGEMGALSPLVSVLWPIFIPAAVSTTVLVYQSLRNAPKLLS